jgi:hypothetical protein
MDGDLTETFPNFKALQSLFDKKLSEYEYI